MLVGRDGEVRVRTSLLASSAGLLVTLTGPGGSGKTRPAVALAGQRASDYPEGVFFVDASTAETSDALWSDVASAVDAPDEQSRPPQLFRHLDKELLLILDNLEQLPDADTAVADLLNGVPAAKVLATSRRALLLPGEHVHPVPPLSCPRRPPLPRWSVRVRSSCSSGRPRWSSRASH